jgi:DNA-binding CsgD family transcriptional regulator
MESFNKWYIILQTKLFILFVFTTTFTNAQNFTIDIKIEHPEEPVDIKLYQVKSAFDIHTLVVDDYLETEIKRKGKLFKLTGTIKQDSQLYRLHINKNEKGHLNRSFSYLFLQINKNDSIHIEVIDNDRFANYSVGEGALNIELSDLYALRVKIEADSEPGNDLIKTYNDFITSTSNPETFYVGIADSLIKYEKNILILIDQPSVEEKILTEFKNHYFSKEIIQLTKQLGSSSKNRIVDFYIPVVVIILLLTVAIFKVWRLYQKQIYLSRFQLLSSREKDVLNLLSAGKTNQEIASELYIEVSTVKKHLSNIFKKIKVLNRSEASLFLKKYNKHSQK